MIEFATHGPKLVAVKIDGTFAGWLSKNSRRDTGLHSSLLTWWEGKVDGVEFRAENLTAIKARIRNRIAA